MVFHNFHNKFRQREVPRGGSLLKEQKNIQKLNFFTIVITLELCIGVSSMYLPHSFNIQVGNVLYCNEYSCGDTYYRATNLLLQLCQPSIKYLVFYAHHLPFNSMVNMSQLLGTGTYSFKLYFWCDIQKLIWHISEQELGKCGCLCNIGFFC